MKFKYARIALVSATLLAGSASVFAQAADANQPAIVDAAVTENTYQLFEGNVVSIDKKTRTIVFKNADGETKFVAGPDITNFDQIKKATI